jgi:hypothetical protein
MTAGKLRVARQMLDGGSTIIEIATTIGVGRATSYRHLEVASHPAGGGLTGPLCQAAAAVMAMQDRLRRPRTT